jgi:hypothetical protein
MPGGQNQMPPAQSRVGNQYTWESNKSSMNDWAPKA